MKSAIKQLLDFGARSADCIELDRRDDPRLLRYVDLVRRKGMPMVDAVVEEQTQPLLYVINAARFSGSSDHANEIAELRRRLAMRGEPAWLGVLRPGRLDIYATDLRPADDSVPTTFASDQSDSIGVLPRLAQGENLAEPSRLMLRDVLLGLMNDAGQELKDLGLTTDECIALTGRALFFRYLMGRGIVDETHLPNISPGAHSLEACFGGAISLASTNAWLDQTFNGDLLKLPTGNYSEYFGQLFQRFGDRVARPLEAILGLDQPVAPGASQRTLGELNWGDLDFDHVPIGLLSETYEELMYRFDADARRDTSVYYTPAHIAEYMVAEAFHGHPDGSRARVLDPACGAGVFLVAAFRKLAELRFSETGKRPTRSALRGMLNDQLVGFDINNHARTLAALALYLTALELDPAPAPVEELTFQKLEDRVLVNVADPDSNPATIQPMAGSLGKHLSTAYRGAFDLVIGNPPWTSLKPAYKAIDQIFTDRCRDIAKHRNLPDIAQEYRNPDRVTDLPFVWAAMEWAKPGGRIALALAGRWLFKMSPTGFAARKAIFQALAVTGILNGASIRQSQVWPNVDQPFCLLFADNRLPTPEDQFVFVSPDDDPALNAKGRMRVDAHDAVPVSLARAAEQPELLKTLYRGTALDAKIVRRIREKAKFNVGNYWTAQHRLSRAEGYQVADRSRDDTFLVGLPTLNAHYSEHPFVVLEQALPLYSPKGLRRPHDRKIYRAPLVLIREGLRADRSRGRALVSDTDIAYSESYYGFSAADHKDGEFLTLYLLVLMHSRLFEYFSLMTSGKFGFEREALQLLDVENFPMVVPEELTQDERALVDQAATSLLNNQPDWQALDRTVQKIYGLSPLDAEAIADALSTRSPFPLAKKLAAAPVSSTWVARFCSRLQKELAGVSDASGLRFNVQTLPDHAALPWKFIAVSVGPQTSPPTLPTHWMEQADDLAVSRITLIDAERPLLVIGLLNRSRYWTPTQARLLASDIVWEHGAMLEERAKQ
ncbi:MAG: N-6 DNA methylase [Hydrogenophaga sp.]|nr:N-6 DNA methylase [Hydrogenophaga sp.]